MMIKMKRIEFLNFILIFSLIVFSINDNFISLNLKVGDSDIMEIQNDESQENYLNNTMISTNNLIIKNSLEFPELDTYSTDEAFDGLNLIVLEQKDRRYSNYSYEAIIFNMQGNILWNLGNLSYCVTKLVNSSTAILLDHNKVIFWHFKQNKTFDFKHKKLKVFLIP